MSTGKVFIIEEHQNQIQNLKEELDRLTAAISLQEREMGCLHSELVLSREENKQLKEKMDACDNEILRLKESVANRDSEIKQVHESLISRDDEIKDSLRTIMLKDEEIHQLAGQVYRLSDTLDHLYRSKSWKLTKPLRGFLTSLIFLKSRIMRKGNLFSRFKSYLVFQSHVRWGQYRSTAARLRWKKENRRIAKEIAASGFFDKDWYKTANPDVAKSKTDPLLHYVAYGCHEGRKPVPWFDCKWYMKTSPQAAASGMDPFLYYCLKAPEEKRIPNAAVSDTFDSAVPTGPVEFNLPDSPLVSIIIPVHNQWQYTLWCLRSIQRNSEGVAYEVIVADDASTDQTQQIGQHIKNAVVVKQENGGKPQGFLRNCNRAAMKARGKYILFLNNDTLVQKDWLRNMVEVAEKDETVGIVGAKLIYPDGRLQEAGGIIWNDASGWNYGRLDDPSKPEYNYLRDTDYVSGAAILVRHTFWNDVGGFDSRFEPAYYEDTDLAFEARHRGYRVVYQPKSVIIHFEGISHGTNLEKGVKQHQVINRRRFMEKWHETLRQSHFANGEKVFLARDRNRKHVLVLDWSVPCPDKDSGSMREMNLMKILKQLGYQVTFYPACRNFTQPYMAQLLEKGIFVLCGHDTPKLEEFLQENGGNFQAVIVSRVDVARLHLGEILKYCPQATVIFDTIDLHFLREQRQAQLEEDPALYAKAAQTKCDEMQIMRQADITLVVSDFEAKLLEKEMPGAKVRIVSNIHEIFGCKQSFTKRKDLLFIGGFRHPPNVDAVKWFLNDIFPLIRQRIPGIKIDIIGPDPPLDIQALSAPDVLVLGHVKDVTTYFNRFRISVVPLRYGAGVKGKINLSMSYGLPVVSTLIGCEGMNVENQIDILTADDAESFADAVCRLYNDESLWESISQSGLENVQRHFSFETAKKTISEILESSEKAA